MIRADSVHLWFLYNNFQPSRCSSELTEGRLTCICVIHHNVKCEPDEQSDTEGRKSIPHFLSCLSGFHLELGDYKIPALVKSYHNVGQYEMLQTFLLALFCVHVIENKEESTVLSVICRCLESYNCSWLGYSALKTKSHYKMHSCWIFWSNCLLQWFIIQTKDWGA